MLPTCLLDRPSTGANLQGLPTNSYIQFPTDLYDPLDCHNTTTNNEDIIIPENGIYYITGSARFGDNATGQYRLLNLLKNKTSSIADGRMGFDGDGRLAIFVSGVSQCNKGDTISMSVTHNAGTLQLRASNLCLFLVKKL